MYEITSNCFLLASRWQNIALLQHQNISPKLCHNEMAFLGQQMQINWGIKHPNSKTKNL